MSSFWPGTAWRKGACPRWVVRIPFGRCIDSYYDRDKHVEERRKAQPVRLPSNVCSNCMGPCEDENTLPLLGATLRVDEKTSLTLIFDISECAACRDGKNSPFFHAHWIAILVSVWATFVLVAAIVFPIALGSFWFVLLAPVAGTVAAGLTLLILGIVLDQFVAARVPVRPEQSTLGSPVSLKVSRIYGELQFYFTNEEYAATVGRLNTLPARRADT